jgi:hypothetical protein
MLLLVFDQIFLMLANIFACAVAVAGRSPLELQRGVLEYTLAPFESFIRELWWDVARNPTSDDMTVALTGSALLEAKRQLQDNDTQAEEALRGSYLQRVK